MPPERLQKLLARRGVASRRESEKWIEEGRVSVNGRVVRELGTKVDAGVDTVEVDGAPLPEQRAPIVVLLNKPAGYVTTVRDPHAEKTVMELLSGLSRRVYPVGRLDRETRGVLVLTDDGELAHTLLHPSHGVEKVYEVTATGDFTDESFQKLSAGVELEDGHLTQPVKISGVRKTAGGVRFRMTLKEGHKRQVRQMVRAVGGRVVELVRISFGGLKVEGMPEGSWRILKKEEVRRLRAGQSPPEAKGRSGGRTPRRSRTGGPRPGQKRTDRVRRV